MPCRAISFRFGVVESTHFLNCRNADVTVGRVVPHDVDDIRRSSVLLSQFGQPCVKLFVFRFPPLPVLSFEHVVLGVMHDALLCCRGKTASDDEYQR